MSNKKLACSTLLFICLAAALPACQTTGTLGSDGNTIHRARWATFDGDVSSSNESKDFYIRHRVLSLDGHELHGRRNPRIKELRFDYLLRDCKLSPGQHSIDIEYLWTSLEEEKQRGRQENWQFFGFFLGVAGGAGIATELPESSRFYPCHATITFDVQSVRNYQLHIVHTGQSRVPDEFQMVETKSGTVVGSTRPTC
jgi:hypothetical protein